MKALEGYKTYIVFGVLLLNELLKQVGWGLELPAPWDQWYAVIVPLIGMLLRTITNGPAGFRFLGIGAKPKG